MLTTTKILKLKLAGGRLVEKDLLKVMNSWDRKIKEDHQYPLSALPPGNHLFTDLLLRPEAPLGAGWKTL